MITVPLVLGWFAAAAGVLTTLAGLVTVGAQRRKLAAEGQRVGVDSAKILSDTAMSLLQEQTTYYRGELEQARRDLADCRHGRAALA